MSQEVINLGAFANDGSGDPLRTALQKTNNNFGQLFTTIGTSSLYLSGNSIVTATIGDNINLAPTSNVTAIGSVVVAPQNQFVANNAVFNGTVTVSSAYSFIGNLTGVASSATTAAAATYATTAGTASIAINAQNYSGTQLPNVTAIGNLNYINVGIMNVATINTSANLYALGNIVAGAASYVLGNGYYLSGLSVGPASYGNSNACLLYTSPSPRD